MRLDANRSVASVESNTGTQQASTTQTAEGSLEIPLLK